MAHLGFKKEKQQQSHVFFDIIFYVYTRIDNRERARASDWKQKIWILHEEKHDNSKRWWGNEKC